MENYWVKSFLGGVYLLMKKTIITDLLVSNRRLQMVIRRMGQHQRPI